MAGPRDNSAAEDTVFGNLGIDANDFNDDTDLSTIGQDDPDGGGGGLDDDADPSVTHTRDQRQQPERDQSRQRQQPQQRDQNQQQRRVPDGQVRPDAKGNLVNAQGQIVAKAGSERRLYTELHTLRRDTAAQTNDLNSRLRQAVEIGRQAITENEKYKATEAAIGKFGLNSSDHVNALQLYVDLKADPAKTLKALLTRAHARGITLDQVQGTDSTKAIADVVKEILSTELKPLRDQTEASRLQSEKQQKDAEALRQAETEIQRFFDLNPDAKQYMPVFHNLLSQPQFAQMTLGEVWARIQLNLMRNQGDQRQNPRNPQRGVRPAGRGRAVNGTGRTDMSPVNMRYDDILKGVLDEEGVR